ncbi:c-type cytochrome [Planctobacterium marinum]|uniref:Cytochrome c n=1 Tax=Planctobacterium marinum TaxID=1631968 RepID=A0AA48KU32_9ALTE|nr:cytochrome c [Planctobacterium marinum]
MKKLLVLMVSAALLATTAVAQDEADSQKEARAALKFRQSLFQLIRSNMGALGAMAKGNAPFDAAVMEKNGMRIEQLSLMIEDYMATDTRKYKLDTEALDKIWEQPEAFSEKVAALTSAAQNLQAVAKAGDESKFRAAIGGVGRTCKGCHDDFKAD